MSKRKKNKNKDKIILDGGYIPIKIDNIKEHIQEINRGCGIHKSKKFYTRKIKHRRRDNYDI